MLSSTTETIEDKKIKKNLGLVHGEDMVTMGLPFQGLSYCCDKASSELIPPVFTFGAVRTANGVRLGLTPILSAPKPGMQSSFIKTEDYLKALDETRINAIKMMESRAAAMGANAVVGVDVKYESVANGSLLVTAIGTAVII